ncbi:MAG: nucleoside triphosphate pyrophosphohydrolase [Candidatus Riflebacteria bacterium]|nr:nucleoside triphosphate pyrophosphohydrolase [Candidatus Riflebacteria bacterium]
MLENTTEVSQNFLRLIEIMAILRSPSGCPWDRQQTSKTLTKYFSEETEEVIEAIQKNGPLEICEELGDLLMLIIFQSQLAIEKGEFSILEVLQGINRKLVDRHPHVFQKTEEKDPNLTAEKVVETWKDLKVEEKKEKSRIAFRMNSYMNFHSSMKSSLHIQEEAKKVGFDFPNISECFNKISEETSELKDVLTVSNQEKITEELGDLLFSVINFSRLLGINPEDALKISNEKFIKRFSELEQIIENMGNWKDFPIQELDKIWNKIKKKEKIEN